LTASIRNAYDPGAGSGAGQGCGTAIGAVAAKYYTVTAYTDSNTSYTDCFAFTRGFKGGKLAVGGLAALMSIAGCAFGEGKKHLLF
jgi:hypothetical protein